MNSNLLSQHKISDPPLLSEYVCMISSHLKAPPRTRHGTPSKGSTSGGRTSNTILKYEIHHGECVMNSIFFRLWNYGFFINEPYYRRHFSHCANIHGKTFTCWRILFMEKLSLAGEYKIKPKKTNTPFPPWDQGGIIGLKGLCGGWRVVWSRYPPTRLGRGGYVLYIFSYTKSKFWYNPWKILIFFARCARQGGAPAGPWPLVLCTVRYCRTIYFSMNIVNPLGFRPPPDRAVRGGPASVGDESPHPMRGGFPPPGGTLHPVQTSARKNRHPRRPTSIINKRHHAA